MSALDPDRCGVIVDRLLTTPVAAKLRIRLGGVEPGKVSLLLPFDPANVTRDEILHGGVIATLADVAAVAGAVSAAAEVPSGGATANLSITYLTPADGSALIATAQVLRSGSRQHVVRVEVASDEGPQVAEALVTVLLQKAGR